MPCSSPKGSLVFPAVAGDCGSCNAVVQAGKYIKMKLEEQLVLNLCDPVLRGNTLTELSKVPLLSILIHTCRLFTTQRIAFLTPSGVPSRMLKSFFYALWFSEIGLFSCNDGVRGSCCTTKAIEHRFFPIDS
jgi:hypothetical protein